VECGSLVDFDLLDCGKNQAHHFEPVFVAGLHGGLHIFLNLGFKRHD